MSQVEREHTTSSVTWSVKTGHALSVLRRIPDRMFHACVTSPPYFGGLRDYKTPPAKWGDGWVGELGWEDTPEMYVAHLVEVFHEVRRTLRDDGTLWLNIGDTYATGMRRMGKLKSKDMIGIPWLVAMALRDDGWYLRIDNIWAKGVSGQKECLAVFDRAMEANGVATDKRKAILTGLDLYVGGSMPENVVDRTTRSHEYVFMLSKSAKYYYDASAVREEAVGKDRVRNDRFRGNKGWSSVQRSNAGVFTQSDTRNRRSVWTIPLSPFHGAHFAVYPVELAVPCVEAGAPVSCCVVCGSSSCGHGAAAAPGVVLDPFAGSGTTGVATLSCGRSFYGIEIHAGSADMARERISGVT